MDRFLANNSWLNRFREVFVKHLPKLKSDHVPILLVLENWRNSRREERPFRFLALWLTHEDFSNLMSTSWKKEGNLKDNILSFTAAAKIWNKEVFGHITRKKNRILLRLEGISRKLALVENKFLEKL